jgi:hypothetical protein
MFRYEKGPVYGVFMSSSQKSFNIINTAISVRLLALISLQDLCFQIKRTKQVPIFLCFPKLHYILRPTCYCNLTASWDATLKSRVQVQPSPCTLLNIPN